MDKTIERLLSSPEPSIRYKVRTGVLGEPVDSPAILQLRQEIRASDQARGLLCARDAEGRIKPAHHTYRKWKGAHWVLARLADMGYPANDKALAPVIEQVLGGHFPAESFRIQRHDGKGSYSYVDGITMIDDRPRGCASIPAYVLFSCVKLGFADDRCAELARKLLERQWPDGGWNCDRKPTASNSSFWETLIPLRALAAYGSYSGDTAATEAAARAAQVFLKRRLFRRLSDGSVMDPAFVKLHYPCYWRYDILFGLKVLTEAGFISDSRCSEALELLESKRLPDGGWPAEGRFYRVSSDYTSGTEWVSWGQVSSKRMNEWVTADALCVLSAAGRLTL